MRSLTLNFVDVPDTNLMKLKRALSGYLIRKIDSDHSKEEKYQIYTVWNMEEKHVAFALVFDDKFEFQFEEDAFSADYFQKRVYSLKS